MWSLAELRINPEVAAEEWPDIYLLSDSVCVDLEAQQLTIEMAGSGV